MVRLALPVLMMLTLVACGGRASEPPPTLTSFGQLPLTFVENRGQTDSQVRFQVNGPGHAFFLTREEIALSLKDVGLSLRFVDASPVTPVGGHRVPGTTNYIQGEPRVHRHPGLRRGRLPRAVAGHRHGAARRRRRAQVRVPRAAGRRPGATSSSPTAARPDCESTAARC